MAGEDDVDGFAPTNPLDGRQPYDWKSRYAGAHLAIYGEAVYLVGLLVLAIACLLLVWEGKLGSWVGVADSGETVFKKAGYVWIGGLLGGVTFSMKWLYHSVARGHWNSDRRLWRLFTPLLSSVLAVAAIALLVSGLFDVLDQERVRQPTALFALAFLAGYFSDNTVAALARFADKYLGESKQR